MSAKFSRLVAKAGASKGKRFQLKTDSVLLGSARSCGIRLKGDYVADEHATLRKRVDGKWIVESQSEYGILVNAESVEARVLSHGDTIQIGATNLLQFEDLAQLNHASESAGAGGQSWKSLSPKSPKQVAIFVGLLVYLSVMAVLLSDQLGGGAAGARKLDAKVFRGAIEATLSYARSGTVLIEDAERSLAPGQPGYLFYRLASVANTDTDDAESAELSEALKAQLEGKLLDAYQFQESGQYARAIDRLNQVYLMVPDPRAPITRYTLSMMSAIKSEANRG